MQIIVRNGTIDYQAIYKLHKAGQIENLDGMTYRPNTETEDNVWETISLLAN